MLLKRKVNMGMEKEKRHRKEPFLTEVRRLMMIFWYVKKSSTFKNYHKVTIMSDKKKRVEEVQKMKLS